MLQKLISPLTEPELRTLEEMGRRHPFAEFRFRARGIVALNAKCKSGLIAQVLGVTEQSVYNWAKWWRKDGLVGLLGGHKGGRPVKLTAEMVESAVNIGATEALTLEGIKQRVRERFPEAPDFSIDRLAARLKERRFSYKRCRLSLKKSVLNKNL